MFQPLNLNDISNQQFCMPEWKLFFPELSFWQPMYLSSQFLLRLVKAILSHFTDEEMQHEDQIPCPRSNSPWQNYELWIPGYHCNHWTTLQFSQNYPHCQTSALNLLTFEITCCLKMTICDMPYNIGKIGCYSLFIKVKWKPWSMKMTAFPSSDFPNIS